MQLQLLISLDVALASVLMGGVINIRKSSEWKATGQVNFLKLITVEVKTFFGGKDVFALTPKSFDRGLVKHGSPQGSSAWLITHWAAVSLNWQSKKINLIGLLEFYTFGQSIYQMDWSKLSPTDL